MGKKLELLVLAVAAAGVFLTIRNYQGRVTKESPTVKTQYGAQWDKGIIYV